ncbi:MAG: tRNA pseudouridine(55) synthase TruB [Firmicutes bacterium]|nr:tRNA pseudouridine(55) synthase TruB [Bacillota bacterium]
MNAIINLLKPAGMSSHDAVYLLRKLTGFKHIGHTGTLDPMAAGVLPLCLNSAARINEYLDMDRKTYRCEMILGLTTETMDIWGEVVDDQRDQARGITEEEILKAMEPIHGMILQTPPKYSAVRIDGRRLYDYARSGDEVKIPKRPVVIYSLDLVHYDPEKGRVMFDVVCSKGTYIRSICHDVGQTLGVGATMSFLVRTATGAFTLENAATPEQLQENWTKYVMPADLPLPHLGRLDLRKGRGAWFSNGGWLMNSDLVNREEPGVKITDEEVMKHIGVDEKLLNSYRVYEDGLFLGTALWKEDQKRYIADKVFRHEGF